MIYRLQKLGRDAWALVVAPLLGIVVGVLVIHEGIVNSDSPISDLARLSPALKILGVGIIAIGALVGALLLWIRLSAQYEITSEELIVRSGPVRLRYPLSSIAEAIVTRSSLGPAFLDVIHIQFRLDRDHRRVPMPLRIAPVNQTEFLRELAERVPGLIVRV